MRKKNNSPWIGRTLATAIMVLVGLGVLAGSASAQNSPIILDNVMGWWNHLGCAMKINAVNAIVITGHDGVLDPDETAYTGTETDSSRQWCVMFDNLGQNEQRALNAGAMQSRADGGITTGASDRVFDRSGWWDGLTVEGQNIAVGGTATAVVLTAALTSSQLNAVMAAYDALMSGMMTTDDDDEEEAPALPLVGIGLLGLLLAGRGAWLRRRA